MMKCFLLLLLIVVASAIPRPQDDEGQDQENNVDSEALPKPYQYMYTVKDEEKQLFYDKEEEGTDEGKVIGRFSVLLADGRLMTVTYEADQERGFVPRITFEDHADPFNPKS